jgi:hypothetical protein
MGSSKGAAGSKLYGRAPDRGSEPPIALDPLKAKESIKRPMNGPPIIQIGMKGLMMILQVTGHVRIMKPVRILGSQ